MLNQSLVRALPIESQWLFLFVAKTATRASGIYVPSRSLHSLAHSPDSSSGLETCVCMRHRYPKSTRSGNLREPQCSGSFKKRHPLITDKSMFSTLVLSPESYPWDLAKEQTFIDPELPSLIREFDRVILVPQQVGGNRFPLPTGVIVDQSYASESKSLTHIDILRRATLSGLLGEELLQRGALLFRPSALKRLLFFAGRAHHAKTWASAFAGRQPPGERFVFYTYWWGATTTGFGLSRKGRVITRAHGFDLYEDRHTPAYLPCRRGSLRLLDGIFPDSDRGREYLEHTFGNALCRCETARLGVSDPGLSCPPSADGVLRVVSCSVQVPVKRLDLLIDGLGTAGRMERALRIEWTHFGTGFLQPELERQVAAAFPPNVTHHFAGYSDQKALFAWYGANPVDVFVNVSASEGTPVSIMEAIACGIPVLATSVGGNVEIATERNGLRLPPNPSACEVAATLLRFRPSGETLGWRAGSLNLWREQYDADSNLSKFAKIIRQA